MTTSIDPRPDSGPGSNIDPAAFMRRIFPNAEDLAGRLNLYTMPDKRSHWFAPVDIDAAAQRALELAESHDVYYGLGLVDVAAREQEARAKKIREGIRDPKIPLGFIRGSIPTVTAFPGFIHDADLADETAHKKTALPTSIDEVLALYDETFPGRPPTIVVDSGYGLHSYWLLKEAYAIETDAERDDLADRLYRFQATINAAGKRRGWTLDSTADLARVLRLPGTINHKGGQARRVRVIRW